MSNVRQVTLVITTFTVFRPLIGVWSLNFFGYMGTKINSQYNKANLLLVCNCEKTVAKKLCMVYMTKPEIAPQKKKKQNENFKIKPPSSEKGLKINLIIPNPLHWHDITASNIR